MNHSISDSKTDTADQLIRHSKNFSLEFPILHCPVCDFEYVHLHGVDASEPDRVRLHFQGECLHEFDLVFTNQKGIMEVVVEGVVRLVPLRWKDGEWVYDHPTPSSFSLP